MLTIDWLNRQVYGPYVEISKRKGKEKPRRTVVCLYGSGRKCKRKKIPYARWLMECHLKRELLRTETVDHDDEDTLNDDLGNLKIMTLKENIRKSHRGPKMLTLTCCGCGKVFERTARRTNDKDRSYCSVGCGKNARKTNALAVVTVDCTRL